MAVRMKNSSTNTAPNGRMPAIIDLWVYIGERVVAIEIHTYNIHVSL